MTRTTAILRVGVVTGAMVVSTMAVAGEPTAANDLIRFGELQKRFEEARNLGLFTKASGEELAYYYSERVPSKTIAETGLDYTRVVKTSLTDCSSSAGFPAGFPVSPKFLYGGLDPYSLVQKAKDTRVEFPHLVRSRAQPGSRSDAGRRLLVHVGPRQRADSASCEPEQPSVCRLRAQGEQDEGPGVEGVHRRQLLAPDPWHGLARSAAEPDRVAG